VASRKITDDGGSLRLDAPGVVSVSAYIKLIGGWEFEWSLNEALKDGLCVFSHVELWSGQMKGRAGQPPDFLHPDISGRVFTFCDIALCW